MHQQIPRFAMLFLVGLAAAQAPTRDLHLVGDRFKPLTYDQMTPAQQTMTEHLLTGERGGMTGPFNVLLRSPEMGDAVQKLGAQVRYHSSLPPRLNEFAIIIAGRFWNAQYEWYAHKRLALQAGLNPAIVEAIQNERRPDVMRNDKESVYTFCTELLNTKHVGDATFAAAQKAVGERGVVELMGVMSWYQMVSML